MSEPQAADSPGVGKNLPGGPTADSIAATAGAAAIAGTIAASGRPPSQASTAAAEPPAALSPWPPQQPVPGSVSDAAANRSPLNAFSSPQVHAATKSITVLPSGAAPSPASIYDMYLDEEFVVREYSVLESQINNKGLLFRGIVSADGQLRTVRPGGG